MAAEAMHRLVVTPVGARGFAFAKDLELGTTVFLHCSHAPAKFKFEVGRKLVATVVQRSHGTHGAHIACEHWPRSTDTGRSSKNPVRLLVPLLEFNRVRLSCVMMAPDLHSTINMMVWASPGCMSGLNR